MNKTEQIVHFYNVDPLLESAQDVGEAIHSETNSVKKATTVLTQSYHRKKLTQQTLKSDEINIS